MRSTLVLRLAKVLGGLAIVFATFLAVSFALSLADGRSPRDLGAALLTVALLLVISIPVYVFGSGNVPRRLRADATVRPEYGYVTSFWLRFIVLPATQSPGIVFALFAVLALALTEQRSLSRPVWRLWARLWKVEQ
jgi:hypothetical protein